MPKPKKSLRSFRCSDPFWKAIELAAEEQGMSCNEWVNLACARALKDPVVGDPIDISEVAKLANSDAVMSIADAIARTNKIFEETAKKLGVDKNKIK